MKERKQKNHETNTKGFPVKKCPENMTTVTDTVQNLKILMMLLMNLMKRQVGEVHSGNSEIGLILELRQQVILMTSQIRGTSFIL